MFRAIIFDMDGLMVDTEPLYWDVARAMAREHGSKVEDATLRKMMGRSRYESMRIYAADTRITRDPELLLADRERLMLDRFAAGVEPLPGLHEILSRFGQRLVYAVATSSPKKFTDVLLPSLGIDKYFKIIQTGDGITNGKPDPEIYLKAIAQLDVQPAECIVLEDSQAGSLAGHRAGAHVIAVPTHLTANEDFSFVNSRARDLFDAADQIDALIRRG